MRSRAGHKNTQDIMGRGFAPCNLYEEQNYMLYRESKNSDLSLKSKRHYFGLSLTAPKTAEYCSIYRGNSTQTDCGQGLNWLF